MFEVYASTPQDMSPAEIAAHARRAEAMGYDGLHVPDAVHDGFILSAIALNATKALRVGTAVLVAFPRSPMNVAITAWDLQQMSGGRFELGLGTQVKGNIEKRYSTSWSAPAPRMRDYIQSLRAIFNCFQQGGSLDFRSAHYEFTRLQPFFNPGPIEHPDIPIYLGAVGPLMTQLAGEVSDGLITHPTNTPPRYIEEVTFPRINKGVIKAERQLQEIKLLLGSLLATGVDEEMVAVEREKQRNLLGFLYSTPAYWPSLELFGWQEKGEHLLQLTREGRWQDMKLIVDDDMLTQFVPVGTYKQIAAVLQAHYGHLSAIINFPLPENPAHDEAAAKAIAELREIC